MGFDNTVTVVGNVTRDPELRFAQSGTSIAQFGVAWNRRRQDQEDEVSFFDVTCFGQMAENVSESLKKGARVVVYGRLEQRSWETEQGDRRSRVSIVAEDIAPSLKWATAAVTKNERSGGGDYRGGGDRGGDRGSDRGGSYRGDSGPRQAPARSDSYQQGSSTADDEPF